MFEQRIHLITLGVADMARSHAFYEALGWSRSPLSQESMTFYQAGGQILGLYQADKLAEDTGLADPRPGGITLAVNARKREDVDAMMRRAVEAGGTVLKAPVDTPWGGYVAYIADPDGHPWEFTYVDVLVPDADGALTLPG